MLIALLVLAVVVGSVVFNFTTPFHLGPIASNWGLIDVTIWITFVLCGAAFVVLGLYMAWWIYKYQYKPGNLSEYEPENPVLEGRLTIITTIGVVVMLAPGLVAWNDYVNVPDDATELEVFSEQWNWKFRLPGEDGVLGKAHNRNYDKFDNPFGIDVNDPYGQDDIVVTSSTIQIPVDRKVKVLLRSLDVLHDFWVPEIRAKMDSVPGMVTYFWFEPIRTGDFEILCAELCGREHHSMRGTMQVVSLAEYQLWLDNQITFAEQQAGIEPLPPEILRGRQVALDQGCFACHSDDGSQVVGPTWKDMWGAEVEFEDGTSMIRDEAYVKESIFEPNAKIVKGFSAGSMTPIAEDVSVEDLQMLIEYLKHLTPMTTEIDPAPLEPNSVPSE